MDRIIEITEEIDIEDKAIKYQIFDAEKIDIEYEPTIEDQIFNASMEKKWARVQELYSKNKSVHESKLTKSEDTALHLAISSYNPDRDDSLHHPHLPCIKTMIASIPEENRLGILKRKNEEGNTPLHLAAELGIVPIIECLAKPEDYTLIEETNVKGETPLFIAAYQGKLKAFLYLHKCVQDENGEGPTELCRRKDGDNILHAAISGAYFELAFQIIHHYPLLVNRYNTKGMSPLHFLSRMPQVFKSGSHFRFIDSIIYYCINIDELGLMTYKPEDKEDSKFKLGSYLPENYQTLVEFLELLRYGTRKIRGYIIEVWNQENKPKATTDVNQDEMSRVGDCVINLSGYLRGHQSDRQYHPENPPIKDTTGVTDANQEKKAPGHQNDPKNPPTQAEGKRKGQLFPANFFIFIKFLKCLMKIVLSVLGIDYIIEVWNRENKPKDTANVNQDKMSQGHQSDCQYDPENATIKAEGKRWNFNGKLFPPNYTIFIEFLKCLMKIVLIVLGIGFPWIKKIEERKRQHGRGVQIMKLLIENDERYKFYESTGEEPKWGFEPEYWDRDFHFSGRVLAPPTKPPLIVEDEDQSKTAATDEKKKDDHKSVLSKPTKETTLLEEASRMGIVEMVEKILKILPKAIQDTDSKELSKPTKETPLLVASKMGIVEMVKIILEKYPIAIQDMNSDEKNILLLAVEHRQPDVYNWLMRQKYPPYVYYQVDKDGNNAVHLAAMFQKLEVWRTPGSALQLQDERKWYKYVKQSLPPPSYVPYNNKGQTPRAIFIETHANLLKDATEWLIKTANSCSVVAALIATVAFTTAATIPGGPDDLGHPHFQNQPAFEVFCISSLVSLCFSVSALVFFLAILTSRCQHEDFEKDLPRKLLIGLTSLFASITAIMVSFCAAHFFILQDKFKEVAFLIYVVTCIPVVFFAFNQFPLYVDLMSSSQELPIRSYKGYKEFFTDSSVASSSDQKKADKAKDV